MSKLLEIKKFSQINLEDHFFDTKLPASGVLSLCTQSIVHLQYPLAQGHHIQENHRGMDGG